MYRKGCCICKGWFCSSKPNQSLLCVTTIISGQTLTLRAAPRSEKLGYNSLVLQFSTSWTQHDTKREKIYNFKQTPRKPPAFKLRLGCNNCNRYENHLIYAALTNGYLLRSTHMKLWKLIAVQWKEPYNTTTATPTKTSFAIILTRSFHWRVGITSELSMFQ